LRRYIIAEGFQHTFGTFTGGTKVIMALAKGVENLPPEHADIINRQLSRGLIGNALFLLGFCGAGQIGGYYIVGEQKRGEEDLKPGEIRLGEITIPRYVTHAAKFTPLLLGASVRNVYDQYVEGDESQSVAIVKAVGQSLLCDVREQPFINEMTQVVKAFDPHGQAAFFGEIAKSKIPQAVQWTAKYLDEDTKPLFPCFM
jgi:hypothetical protein